MVFLGDMLSLLDAVCCSVEVIKGGGVELLRCLVSMEATVKSSPLMVVVISWACSPVLIESLVSFSPLNFMRLASMFGAKTVSIDQYSTGTKARISRSRSMTILSVDD